MTDTELRGLLLQKYYNKRREGYFRWEDTDFEDVPEPPGFDGADVFRVCDQLGEHGLIDWHPTHGIGDARDGMGKITAFGVDVVENGILPPISITFDHSVTHTVTVQGSSNVQVGNNNSQDFSIHINGLIDAIEKANGTEAEKAEAKSLLSRFLAHPLVTSIAGGLVAGGLTIASSIK